MLSPLFTFIIYAQEDREDLKALKKHLRPLELSGEIKVWDDGDIIPGADWDQETKNRLRSAEIVLLLISPNFFNSDNILNDLLPIALDQHDQERCIAVPVIMRSCIWRTIQGIKELYPLPVNGEAIFDNPIKAHDRSLMEVAEGVQRVVAKIRTPVERVMEDLNEQEKKDTTESVKKKVDTSEILLEFRLESHLLRNSKSTFQNLEDSHLPRPETEQIIHWIDAPLPEKEKGIVLVVGDAGTGKSVVLRDVLLILETRLTPVLGIKADQYCSGNVEMLEKRLAAFAEMVGALTLIGQQVIVLIDQIDALSQSLSARREYLDLYTHFVLLLSEIPDVRIILSCRTYDLQNDHDFSFYRQQRNFALGKLSIEQVHSILKRLSPGIPKLPDDLLILLQTPLHLDLFCQIYRQNLPFEKIKALRDLYEEFWSERVLSLKPLGASAVNPQKITELVFGLAQEMYDRQNLAVPINLFREKFLHELAALESGGIIFKSQEGVVFFHQTFYDFAFAKHFVQSKVKVEKYLLQNKQNLHIRSCLKMMLEFLREQDPKEHLRVMRAILASDKYYFHIKSLVLSLLGYVQKPTGEEMKFVRDFVFSKPELFKAFIESVKSREWLLFLLETKKLEWFAEPAHEGSEVDRERFYKRAEILNTFLQRHLPESRDEVLGFVSDLPEFESKSWLVLNTLDGIKIWDNPLALQLFEKYSPTLVDVFIYKFLQQAVESNIENLSWALEHLKALIEKAVNGNERRYNDIHFEYSLTELVSHFAEKYPEPTFDLLFNIHFPTEKRDKPVAPGAIYGDFLWLSNALEDINNKGLFALLIDCARILSKNQSPRFLRFVHESLDSQFASQLLVLVEGFRANPSIWVNEIVSFFHNFLTKQGVDAEDNLSWRTRHLLQEAYPYFSDLQKLFVIQLVSQIESEREKERATERSEPKWIGHTRFIWLKYLPEQDLSKIAQVAKNFRELTMRFPDAKDDTPSKFRVYTIGPPLEEVEYQTMSLNDWKASFLINYKENHEREWGSNKGGMPEHARRFQEEVKKRPDFFYPLIEELTQAEEYPKTYLVHGLSGLKDVKYAPEKLLHLLKRIDLTGFESWEVISVLGLFGDLANKKTKDDFVIQFLVKAALEHPDPVDDSLRIRVEKDEIDSLFNSGFNTVRGYAVHLLPYFHYFSEHENLIFTTLEQVAEHDLLTVRCQMMPRLALLSNLDKDRTLRLFLLLIHNNEPVVMEHSSWSAQYLVRQNFEGMMPYFEKALSHPKLYKSIGIILSLVWVLGQDEALEWLNRFIEKSEEAKVGAIEVAARNISVDKKQANLRSIELFEQFLSESGEEIINAYDFAFQYLKAEDFQYLRPTLERFAHTVIARKNPRPFYEFLIACATAYPEDCLKLAEHFAEYQKPDIRYTGYYDSEPLKVVINAYHALWGRKIKDKSTLDTLEKALRLFDRMLLDDRFRRYADGVLEKVEH